MKPETAILLSIGVLAGTVIAYAYSKEKPYISTMIMGSLGAFGLIYTLIKREEVSEIRTQLGCQ